MLSNKVKNFFPESRIKRYAINNRSGETRKLDQSGRLSVQLIVSQEIRENRGEDIIIAKKIKAHFREWRYTTVF